VADELVTTTSYVICHVPSISWVVFVSVLVIVTSARSMSAQSAEVLPPMPLVTDAVFHTPPPWFGVSPHVSAASGTVAATVTVRDTVYMCVAPAGK
jgi:hypothetical protein